MAKENTQTNNQKDEIAISVENISKTFKIPHEKHSSLKSTVLNVFKKKTYTNLYAVKNIGFEVKKGEFFGIIGRNGSGKSTLLKMLAGIYTSDSGKITINGKLSPFLELGVGFNPELTARENVYLGGAILGLTQKEIDEKLDEIIRFAELEEFVDMKFKNFSSGMQVRLAFALSINAHAEILLMDEVLAVGDSNFQKKCLKEFKRHKDQGKTVVLVSHGIAVVEKYCDRAMLLRNGKVQIIDEAREVCREYIKENNIDEEKYKLLEASRGGNKPTPYKISTIWKRQKKEFENSMFTPLTLSLMNEKNELIREAVSNNDNIWICIEGFIKKTNPKLTIGFALFDQSENEIFWSYQTDDKILAKKSYKSGKIKLRARFPKRILNEGKYTIKMIASLHYTKWILDPTMDCPKIEFEISGGLSDSIFWQKGRGGLIAPLLLWEDYEEKN